MEHLLNGKQLLSLFVLMHWLACLCVSMDDSLLHYAILVKLFKNIWFYKWHNLCHYGSIHSKEK